MENNNNNGKTVYKIILTIVTVACIITGVVLHVGNWFSGISTKHWKGVNWGSVDLGEYIDYSTDVNSFSSLNVNVDIGDITIEEGDTFSITYRYPKNYSPEFSVSNNKLTLTQKTPNTINLGVSTDWNNVYVTVTIPSGTKLDVVDLDTSLGDVKLNGYEGKSLDITDSLGDIEVKNCSFNNVEVNDSLGNVTLNNVKADEITTKLSMGDMKFENVTVSGKTSCDSSMGDIRFTGESKELNFDDSMGDIKVEIDCDWTGKLDTDMGEITVNGNDQGNTYTR